MKTVSLAKGKKIYFASDQHFGAPNPEASKVREERFICWLDSIKADAQILFLMGDLFDFWHEWKHVVPKGFIRVLGKIAELKDSGIEIYFFVGNHDLWMRNYFEDELGIPVFFEKQYYTFNDKVFLLAHGDGLGPGDKGYKRMKKVFRRAYKERGMAGYSELQEREFALQSKGFRAVKHQSFVGTGYFDTVQTVVTSGNMSTAALVGSTEEEQFH